MITASGRYFDGERGTALDCRHGFFLVITILPPLDATRKARTA
jgi:hypothetical protein